ncbi:MAG: Transcription elongation factor SPT6, partial [Paramarteilia canceri]
MSAPDGSRSAALIASDSSDSRFTVDNESEVPYEEVEPIENLNESFEGLPEINEGEILDSDGYGTKEINPNENFAFNNTENLSEHISAPKISNYSLSQAQEIFGISESDDEDLYNISSEEEISGMSDFIEDDEFGDDEVNKNNARIVVSSDNESDLSEADHPKPAKKPKMVSSHSKKASLSEKFMPDELEKHFLSLKQQVVALKDIPERYLSDDLVLMGEISSNNIEIEAEWIFNSYFGKQILSKSIKMPFVDQKKSLIAKIVNSLEMMKHQHLDIPFIWHYRSEFVRPELSIEYLWKIFEYDRQFILKKNKAFELCKALIESENSRLLKNDNQKSRIKYRRADSSLLMMVENISSMTDLSDFNGYINFYFPHLLLEISSEKEFKALKSSKFFYTLCSENRLTELLPYFGLTPKQLAENLNENYSINHINQSDYSLESLAIKYVNKRFPSVEMISATVIRLLAMEIAIEPTILNYFRNVFSTRGVVNIKPTKKGISEIDNNHPCNKFKYIANKPMKCFDKEEFLECYIQEKIGNLVISIDVNTESNNRSEKSLYLEILQHFQWDKFNAITKSWNKHREEVIKIAVNMILLPKIALELKGKMIEESKEYVLRGYAANLTRLVTQKPFDFSSAQEDKSNNENQISAKDLLDKISSPTIMTFVYSLDDSDKSAMATFCDHYGNFIEYIVLPNFHYGPKSSKTKIETKAEDVKTLKEFIKMHMPRVVLVACSSSKASSFHYELKVILSRLAAEDQQFSLIKLFYIDVKVGLGYYNSNLALEEYKN